MNPVYTRSQLESYNRTQLWELCRERGLKCYPKTANCVEAIWNKQQSVELVAVAEIKADEQAVAQAELDTLVAAQAQEIAPEIEVDFDIDPDFGIMYRVWYSYHLLGTFYCTPKGKYIVQPCESDERPVCNTAAEAQLLIVAMSGLLVADATEDVVDLIDKPFDELTVAEWQIIKHGSFAGEDSPANVPQQALQAEVLAA